MPVTLAQGSTISAGDVELFGVNFTALLDSGETLTGTPTVVEVTSTDLTIANKQVNTATVVILGETVAIGMAVLFKISGQVANTSYRVRVTVSTTGGTVVRTFVRDVLFDAV